MRVRVFHPVCTRIAAGTKATPGDRLLGSGIYIAVLSRFVSARREGRREGGREGIYTAVLSRFVSARREGGEIIMCTAVLSHVSARRERVSTQQSSVM